jgi:iron uptake system EfeUOB component EfeO/EfeM
MPRLSRAGAVGAILVLTLAGCTHPVKAAAIELDRGRCGAGWTRPHGGAQTLTVHNVTTAGMDVQLVDPGTKGVYAEVEQLGPGTSRPIHVTLTRGTYAFTCYPDGADAETGPSVTITDGPADGTAAIVPTTENDLAGPVKTYRAHVSAGLATLAAQAGKLRNALKSGDRGDAQAAWLVAQMAYSRLGAAYGTFGDSAAAIDGTPAGLPGGVRDPHFTGLRRIEYGLWHNEPLPLTAKVADGLVKDVAGLRKDFAGERTDPNDLPLRAHEILENSLQFELSGASDQGSGDGLAIISANLDGTTMVMDAIAPVLRPRYAGWPRAVTEMSALQTLVRAQQRKGRWTAPAALPAPDREKLDGALGRLLEDLAPVAAIGEVRREF